jgi:hypothetical protein
MWNNPTIRSAFRNAATYSVRFALRSADIYSARHLCDIRPYRSV